MPSRPGRDIVGSMSTPPDLDDLARRYLALWDRQAAHLASNPAMAALFSAWLAKTARPEAADELTGEPGQGDG